METEVQNTQDWPGRYYHVDQILDRPGPRTECEMFVGGEQVSHSFIGAVPLADREFV